MQQPIRPGWETPAGPDHLKRHGVKRSMAHEALFLKLRMRTPVLLIPILFAALSVSGSAQSMQLARRSPATYTLADLFNRSDRVVLGRITAADTGAYDIPLYKVEVVQAFKGASNGEALFVGPFTKAEIGSSYFFFLRSVPAPIAPRSKASHGLRHGLLLPRLRRRRLGDAQRKPVLFPR